MLNALWIVMQFQFEYVSMVFPNLIIPIGKLYNRPNQKVQILGLVFLILFTIVLVLQFLSMLFHRWGTIAEILSSTRLISRHKKYRNTQLTVQEAVDLLKEMELEKDGLPNATSETNQLTNTTSSGDDYSPQIDADSQANDDDILPEPEIDYFEHPAVNNANNWNNRYRQAMSPAPYANPAAANKRDFHNMSFAQQNQHVLGLNRYNHHETGQMHQHYPNGGVGGNGLNSSVAYSPRQHNTLRPLHGLDSRVMRQFRALEKQDPRFKSSLRYGGPGKREQQQYGGYDV